MTVPQSLLLVALAVAWIVLLVPSWSRRRGHVKETVEGSGFRVLHRAPSAGRRLTRRPARRPAAQDPNRTVRSEDQMTSHQVDDQDRPHADDDTVVLDPVAGSATGAATDAADATAPVRATGSHPYDPDRDGHADGSDAAPRTELDDDWLDEDDTRGSARDDREADELAREEAAAYDEHDEAELRRQYQAWRASTRVDRPADEVAGTDTGDVAPEPEPGNVRPIPRRPGRGLYDPEAAERARAYKFARRRRAVLVLTLLIVGFALGAVLVSGTLWIGTGLSAVLLALFLTYLRRQVRIESDIRARRLAKLQRARQIRPEFVPEADGFADPYAQRAPRPTAAAGPVRHRSNRVVLDLDDDDPGFDDLEYYEPMEYRRAVGQ